MSFREHVVLGRTGLDVSRLGIASGYGVPDHAVERAFHEHGVNYFYWSAPRFRGGMRAALQRLVRGHRDQLVIAMQSYDHSGLLLRWMHERGLRALGIDCADVLILGGYGRCPPERVLGPALKLKEQGKVRFLAMSGHRRAAFRELLQSPSSPIDVFMVRYNAAHRGAETEVFPYLPSDNRPGVTTYTATRWGQLLKAGKMPPADRERPLTAAECYRFVLTSPHVDVCMTGPANAAQLDEALRALDAGPLSDDELARARRIGDHVHG